MSEIVDILVVGGGPCGLAVAIEAVKSKLSHIILEKGSLTESIRRYPRRMRFFSTAENIEIGGIPFPISNVKANREEALQYYRKVAGYFHLNFKLFTEVTGVEKKDEIFHVFTAKGETYFAKNVVIATGYFDVPRKLNVPGEDLPHVSHYYDEPYKYSYSKVVIVGGANSAVEAALELYRHDVDVTIVHRNEDLRQTVKYWLIPDVKNRMKEGKIKAIFNSTVKSISSDSLIIQNVHTQEESTLPADFVFILAGYVPDAKLLFRSGIQLNEVMVPSYDNQTFETNVKGLYVCGTVVAGIHTEKVFIENGREHAQALVDHIAGRPVRPVKNLIMRI
ncbi:YpdA family putative bacillithiol disulfide reductase [Cytophagaceae bacterium DM2B3-1]|uniref:YpdA family putative bacillithiol disulfide reductase n=1 Tax=Xanthocytophaga flava TaxID=3048013 RepID=A0ABT7CYN7_9BACT|nr:YpdA family putative bacillithiol disulfide reductase [Xanthocytophaga flavus]MDJ1498867.1 YpdA family putative bacillithiol disulfide reductase [Xanthocytophaga flavus]